MIYRDVSDREKRQKILIYKMKTSKLFIRKVDKTDKKAKIDIVR